MKLLLIFLSVCIVPSLHAAQPKEDTKAHLLRALYADLQEIEPPLVQFVSSVLGTDGLSAFGCDGTNIGNCCYLVGQAVGSIDYKLSDYATLGASRFEIIDDASLSANAKKMLQLKYQTSEFCSKTHDAELNRIPDLSDLTHALNELHHLAVAMETRIYGSLQSKK